MRRIWLDPREIWDLMLIFGAPILVGISLFFFLNPATFWERLAGFLVSSIFAFFTFVLIVAIFAEFGK